MDPYLWSPWSENHTLFWEFPYTHVNTYRKSGPPGQNPNTIWQKSVLNTVFTNPDLDLHPPLVSEILCSLFCWGKIHWTNHLTEPVSIFLTWSLCVPPGGGAGGYSTENCIPLTGRCRSTPTLIGTKFVNTYPYWHKILAKIHTVPWLAQTPPPPQNSI